MKLKFHLTYTDSQPRPYTFVISFIY